MLKHPSPKSIVSSRIFRCALLSFASFMLCLASIQAQDKKISTQTSQTLTLNQTIEKSIKSKETHVYALKVEVGQFAQIAIAEKGVETTFALTALNGQVISENKVSLGAFDKEIFSFIADSTQDLRLEVRAVATIKTGGSYEISLAVLRPAKKEDTELIKGENLLREAFNMRGEGTPQERQATIDKFQEATQSLREAGDLNRLSIALTHTGRAYNLLGNRPKALEFYNQALALRREIGDRRGETIVLTFMGFAYTLSGELQKAMDCHTQALQIRREIGDARLKAVSLFHIGVVYHRLGEPQRALSYHLQALPALRSYGETGEEARTLSYMGEAYFSLGQFEQALDCFEQSLAVQNRDFKRIIARNVLRRMASVYIAQSQTQKALDVLNEALALEQQYGDTFNKANILVALGNAHYTLGNSQKAREYLVQAMPLLQAIEDRPGEAKAHYLFSQIERDKNNLSNALTEIESAVRLVESMRSRIVCQELRASFFSTVEKYYDQYLQVLWQLHKEQPSKGYDEKALLVSEQTRARSLIELLNESGIDIRQGVSKELLERERILQKQLNEKAKAQLVLSSERATPEQTAELAKEIQDITSALQNVQTQIRKESPRYAALTQPRLLSLREMQETLDENTLLLEYKLGEERSFLWAVTKNELRFYELPKRAEIETQTRKVYQLLTARNQQPANETDAQRSARLVQAENEYNEAASQLSETLIGPIASILKSQRLLIVSDGALQYIPFAALPGPAGRTQKETGGGQPEKPQEKMANNKLQTPHSAFRIPHSAFPLIFNHEVVCLPSASVIAVLRRETSMRKPAPKTVAVFADPVFAADDVRIVGKGKENKQNQIKSTQRGIDVAEFTDISFSADSVKKKESSFSITRLPFSRREANAILSIAPADETYAALDFEANRANAISPALAQYRIVHFATHGWLDSGRPELSGIVLSLVDEKGQPQEGILRLHEIYNLELNADLVVLSACQTGLGKEVKGEGLVGLTRGFMYAGAARVAASLWKVDDAATAELMASFYHFMLKEKMTPSAALRAAQIKLLKEKRWRSPYFWASFVIQGEWR